MNGCRHHDCNGFLGAFAAGRGHRLLVAECSGFFMARRRTRHMNCRRLDNRDCSSFAAACCFCGCHCSCLCCCRHVGYGLGLGLFLAASRRRLMAFGGFRLGSSDRCFRLHCLGYSRHFLMMRGCRRVVAVSFVLSSASRAVMFLFTPITIFVEPKVFIKRFCCVFSLKIAGIIGCFGTCLYGFRRSFAVNIELLAYKLLASDKQ